MITSLQKVSRKSTVCLIFACLFLLFLMFLLHPAAPLHAGSVRYVAPSAEGIGDCSNWENACGLQSALTNSLSGDEIWVLAGVHKPTIVISDSLATFSLKAGVEVYGGFAGSEAAREERDWESNLTILSGDIDGNDITDPTGVVTSTTNITGTNSYHVVTGSGVTETAVLDGFTLTAGYANGTYFNNCGDVCGGGLYNFIGYPTLNNITFMGNHADLNGGGLYNNSSSPVLTNSSFVNNQANYGGGMANDAGSDPLLTNIILNGNSAEGFGGGMFSENSSPTLINASLTENHSFNGGGIANLNSSSILVDVTFSGNTADYGGGMYNTNGNPDIIQVLNDVIFTGNQAIGPGGGMYNYGSAILEDVTFSNNQGYDGGGMYNYGDSSLSTSLWGVSFGGNIAENGGGMFDVFGQTAMTNVTFQGNSGLTTGGGLFENHGSAILKNVVFEENSAPFGGGMSLWDSNPTLTNVTFSGNVASGPGFEDSGYGGGMFNRDDSDPTLTNVTFSGNQADVGGGGAYNRNNGNPSIRNSILWGNTPEQLLNDDSSHPIITYSDVAGGCPAGSTCDHLLDVDPLFVAVGDLRLRPGSPTIDSGNNTLITSSTDLAGGPRFVDIPAAPDTGLGTPPLVDMGAYEANFVDAALLKAVSPPAVLPGASITFTLSFSNGGSITATNVIVSDTIPAFLGSPAISSGGAAITNTGTLPPYVWTVQDLEPGQSGVITITGVLTIPLAAGTYTNTAAIAVDADAAVENNTTSLAFTVLNAIPTFTSAPITVAVQDTTYSYTVSAGDANGDPLTITAPTQPTWLVLTDHVDGTATLSGTPDNGDIGDSEVVLRVTDSGGLDNDQSFTITVANANDAPFFTSAPVTKATQGILYTYTITATDPDLQWGDVLTITAPTRPAWLTLIDHGDGTATLSGTPANGDVGDNEVVLRVTDSGGLDNDQSFTITVANVNDAPFFTSTPLTAAGQGILYTYNITTTDPDLLWGDALTITTPTRPAWLTLSDHGDGTATLSGTPANADIGGHAVVLRATDSGGLDNNQSFTITVANANDAPFFTSAPVTKATQGILYTYTITATDPDLQWGDVLTITTTTRPAWLTLIDHGDGTATLSGTPANGDVGDNEVVLRVTDSGGLTDIQTFTIKVWDRVYLPQVLSGTL